MCKHLIVSLSLAPQMVWLLQHGACTCKVVECVFLWVFGIPSYKMLILTIRDYGSGKWWVSCKLSSRLGLTCIGNSDSDEKSLLHPVIEMISLVTASGAALTYFGPTRLMLVGYSRLLFKGTMPSYRFLRVGSLDLHKVEFDSLAPSPDHRYGNLLCWEFYSLYLLPTYFFIAGPWFTYTEMEN